MSIVTFMPGTSSGPAGVFRRAGGARADYIGIEGSPRATRASPEGSVRMPNRLAGETSPYLLQHQDNPVDWHPWGEAALAEARSSGRPVLLSVGYAACHWCHVMAHESFENPATAALMNELFVNIKVDREERPDLDLIYQHALALLGQPGGWPLTMFLTPDGEPFWGGTYFPPEPRYGRPGLPQVLRQIAAIYRDEPGKVTQNVGVLREALARLAAPEAAAEGIDRALLDRIAARLLEATDPVHGGIEGAPKFPQCAIFALLWRAWRRTRRTEYRDAVTGTLTAMSQGGIYDHLGGGFARYSTDAEWLVPHFEKMLYDNAQLIEQLGEVWAETGDPLYEARLRETVGWVLREMRGDAGAGGRRGFASALDADSEGEEGKFYVWTEAEIERLLGLDAAAFAAAYDVTPGGNWEGHTILNRSRRPALGGPEAEAGLARSRAILLEARSARVPPGRDDKVLADWNGLMIAALARAAALLEEPAWLAAAEEAFAFVTTEMVESGRLRHSWRGRARHPATLDDYANLARAALLLHEATGNPAYLAQAEAWVALVERHYADPAGGGWFLSADDTGDVIVRAKTAADHAAPSGNGTMVEVLARLFYLTGDARYRERGEAAVAAFAGEIARNFFPLATLLNAAELLADAPQLVIVGQRGAADTAALLRAAQRRAPPGRVLQVVAAGEALPAGHPAFGKAQQGGRATAYLCRGQTCSLPLTEPAGLERALAHG
jgi:uncharacterized protein YyaL (SSP411 family)